MRRAGRVVARAQGVLVVRGAGDEPPDIGTTVVDAQLERLGTVVDVFGPVNGPYLAVSPTNRGAADILSEVVYLRDE